MIIFKGHIAAGSGRTSPSMDVPGRPFQPSSRDMQEVMANAGTATQTGARLFIKRIITFPPGYCVRLSPRSPAR